MTTTVHAGKAALLLDFLGAGLPDDGDDAYRDAVLAVADAFPESSRGEQAEILGCVRAMTREWPDAHRTTTERLAFEDGLVTSPDHRVERGSLTLPEWPSWRVAVFEALAAWSAELAATCLHGANNLAATAPVYCAAWKPGLVVCQDCARLLAPAGNACQACGGAGDTDGLCATWLSFGRLIVMFRVCREHSLTEPGRREESSDA